MAHGSAEGAEDCGKGLLYCVGDLVIGAAGVLGEWRGGGGKGAGGEVGRGGGGGPAAATSVDVWVIAPLPWVLRPQYGWPRPSLAARGAGPRPAILGAK